jgi:hypothetical protein
MPRFDGDWSLIEVCEVDLASGVTGVGETILQYTWGGVPREAVARVVGRNVFSLLRTTPSAAGCRWPSGMPPDIRRGAVACPFR